MSTRKYHLVNILGEDEIKPLSLVGAFVRSDELRGVLMEPFINNAYQAHHVWIAYQA